MHIQLLPRHQYARTVLLAVVASMLVVVVAAFLGRATLNMRAALTDKPDLAVYLLLRPKEVTNSVLLREKDTERDYLVETTEGAELVKLKKGAVEWFVAEEEILHVE